MKKALFLAATVAFIAPQAFAQAKSFEGFSVGANLAVAKSTSETTGLASESGNSSNLDLQAQYSWALAPQFVLGLGLTLGTGNNKAGDYPALSTDASTKNRMSFDIVPGYAISNTMVLFGKVSSLSADGVITNSGVETKTSLSGLGYGFGVRGLIDKNMFYQVGYDMNKYNEVTDSAANTYKVNSSVFSLGVGYKF